MTIPHQRDPAPRAAPYKDLLAGLKQHMVELQALREQAVGILTPAVQEVVRGGSRDAQRIEHTLDQLLDIACLPEGLTLFKTLCRHYWTLDPKATADYIHAYREMWDDDDQNDIEQVAP